MGHRASIRYPIHDAHLSHPASCILYLATALALFLALSLKNITLPGLYYDEALDVVPAMQLLYGQLPEPVRGAALTVGGYTLPLMIMDYVGTVNTYLALPVFAVFGVGVTSVRLLPILLAALSLILGYLLAVRLFDHRVAAVAMLLAAVDPSFVFFSRMGIHVTSVMTVFSLGSLLAFLRWRNSGHRRWLALGGLLLGLGLWAKVLFLWWIVALAAAWVVHGLSFRLRKSAQTSEVFARHIPGRGGVAIVLGSMILGAGPLLAYNLATGGTLISLSRNVLVTEHGVSNLDVLRNLAAALKSFIVLLDGRYFWFMGGQFANPLNVVCFALALVGGAVLVRRRPEWSASFSLIVFLIALIVAQSAFTVSGIWATHLYILFPLPQMVMALFVVLVADAAAVGRVSALASERRDANLTCWVRAAAMLGLLAVLMLASLRVDMAYHTALEQSRGLSRFSDAIYKLASWLDERQFTHVYAVDWGIQKNVQILTHGRVNPIEISGYAGEPAEAFVQRAEQALTEPSAVYVFHSKEDTVYELFPAFVATADRLGVRLRIIEAFRDHSGAPVHVIWARE